jgi:lipoprotein-anchoring transpeptidase ErfK/SrfK
MSQDRTPPKAKRTIAVLSAALSVAAAGLVAAGIYSGSSRPDQVVLHRVVTGGSAAPPATTSAASVPAAASRVTPRPAPAAPSDLPAIGPGPETVAYAVVSSVPVFAEPAAAGPMMTLSNPNPWRAPLVFLVLGGTEGWVKVMLPVRPNESTGWVPASDLNLQNDDYAIVVSLSAHALGVYRDRVQVARYPVAVGASYAPTPAGNFFVTEILKAPNPNGAYGAYAFGLSDFSNTYSEFEGGPGQIAIHGTNQPWVIGSNASHGCIRVRDDVDLYLESVLGPGSIVDVIN